ncbi:pentapeptide repeat-containing protein [Curtobacterium sp. Csp1]|uniref:pentapeptide repeat-containing protein n=1 Tax=unclassified Curtobacterium TaxID=257496 RepID=UPI00159793EA|nr:MULTISPECIES: pentapeptide repeat-containing protein [unclassified Curtobacterium]QKS12672.1 pentapeptide repeat-containing protein [Curtobacterium sp. csp3]QKS20278.1 pentapeptide repeat-containing protein [Curtobacterium sp. Csp1]
MARSTGTDAPRITLTEPTDLQDWSPAPGDLVTGDRIEAKRIAMLDVAGERLPDLELEECVVGTLRADGTDLRGLRVRDSVVETLDAPVFRASSSAWREVRVAGGRVGSAELYDATLNGVEFVGMKLGFVNLRGSTLTDVVFRDCVLDELDIADARLLRVSFEGTRIRSAEGSNTRIDHVDLRAADLDRVERLEGFRGATIGADQLFALAPLLAAQAGYRVD